MSNPKPYFQKMITIDQFFSPNHRHYDEAIFFPVPNLIPYKPSYVKPLYQVYNVYMSPRHFAEYAKRDPKGYQTFTDNMWNSFVTVTHKVGLSPFFSFTPDFLEGLNAKQIGKQLGTIYNQSMTDDPITGTFAEGEIPGDQDQTL